MISPDLHVHMPSTIIIMIFGSCPSDCCDIAGFLPDILESDLVGDDGPVPLFRVRVLPVQPQRRRPWGHRPHVTGLARRLRALGPELENKTRFILASLIDVLCASAWNTRPSWSFNFYTLSNACRRSKSQKTPLINVKNCHSWRSCSQRNWPP